MKKFLLHTGLALADLMVFLFVQMWAGGMFAMGAMAALLRQSNSLADPFGLDRLLNRFYGRMDAVMLLCYAATLGVLWALVCARQGPRGVPRAMGLTRPAFPEMLWAPLMAGLAAHWAVSAGLSLLPPDAPLMQDYLDASSLLTVGQYPALEIAVSVLGAPLIEEIVFRGLIYGHLKQVMPRWAALLVQGALFGLVHGQLLWGLFTFALALLMGWMADCFDSIWPAIAVHVCFNGANYLPLFFEPDGVGTLVLLLSSLVIVAVTLLVLALYRRRAASAPAA